MTDEQRRQLIELLWDCMKRDPKNRDRVRTGWGTKTQIGLLSCIDRIMGTDDGQAESARSYLADLQR